MTAADLHDQAWYRQVTTLWRAPDAPRRAALTGARLLGLATELTDGEVLSLITDTAPDQPVTLRLFGPQRLIDGNDLDWAMDPVGALSPAAREPRALTPAPARLWDVTPTLRPEDTLTTGASGLSDLNDGLSARSEVNDTRLPVGYYDDLSDLLPALMEAGGALRIHLAAASPIEVEMLRLSLPTLPTGTAHAYLGEPVRIRMLIGLPQQAPSMRLRVMLKGLGQRVDVVDLTGGVDAGSVASAGAMSLGAPRDHAWNGASASLTGHAQPVVAARILARVPAAGPTPVANGFLTAAHPAPQSPISDLGPDTGVILGQARTSTNTPTTVRVSATDLLRHLHVVGASGTGKSSLLSGMVVSAVEQGYGATVLSPHPDLAERLLRELPVGAADRTIVVRSGDLDAVVPVNPVLEGSEQSLETLMDVFQDLLDPERSGMFGQRAIRLVTLSMRAVKALMPQQASLAAAALAFQDRGSVAELANAVQDKHPDLASDLRTELASMGSDTYSDLIGWYRSRFNRLIGSEAMSHIMGTGADAVDVCRVIDDQQVLLVDLASTTIGVSSAQLVGEMWLAKHWDALARRRDRSQPHLLVVDEAHLLGTGLLPRLLAEGRKFGIGVVVAHQHLRQLHGPLREAIQSNTSSLVSFRVGPTEAVAVAERLGEWSGDHVSRLPNLTAVATISRDTTQTPAFTLTVTHNTTARVDTDLAQRVTAGSHDRFVAPYGHLTPVTARDIAQAVRRAQQQSPGGARSWTTTWPPGARPGPGRPVLPPVTSRPRTSTRRTMTTSGK